jgi:hypothetical protein
MDGPENRLTLESSEMSPGRDWAGMPRAGRWSAGHRRPSPGRRRNHMTIAKKPGGKFQLQRKGGGKALGPVTTKKAAQKQERAIKAAQAKRKK